MRQIERLSATDQRQKKKRTPESLTSRARLKKAERLMVERMMTST